MNQLIGHQLDIDIAEESRDDSDVGDIYRGRQLYARILAFYMFDAKNHALMSLDDLQTVEMNNNDTRQCLRDWDFVWARLDPDLRRLFIGKVEVEMLFKHIKDAGLHASHDVLASCYLDAL